jgi:hypothetical protein
VSLLYGYIACALLTWIALVADGEMRRLTPPSFWRALKSNVRVFGTHRVLLWGFLCLLAWPVFWLTSALVRLEPRE